MGFLYVQTLETIFKSSHIPCWKYLVRFSPLFDATDKGGSRLNLYRARRPNLDGIDAIFTSRFSPAVLRGVVRSRPLPAFPRVSKLNATW